MEGREVRVYDQQKEEMRYLGTIRNILANRDVIQEFEDTDRFCVMMSLGIEDKEGNKIYEGDILEGQTGYGKERVVITYEAPNYRFIDSEGKEHELVEDTEWKKYFDPSKLEVVNSVFEAEDE